MAVVHIYTIDYIVAEYVGSAAVVYTSGEAISDPGNSLLYKISFYVMHSTVGM